MEVGGGYKVWKGKKKRKRKGGGGGLKCKKNISSKIKQITT